MTRRTNHLPEELHRYLIDVSVHEHPSLAGLRRATADHEKANMQIGPEQGGFMAFLVETLGARRCIEVGTFTGYSALAVALALPEDGLLVACDVSEEWTSVGRPFWEEAGVADRIDLRIAPAGETLAAMLDAGEGGSYDFAFIDADKEGYAGYWDQCLELVRPGGVVAVDNTLWEGKLVDPEVTDADTEAIRAFNEMVREDDRVTLSLLPLGDGLTLGRKR